MSVVSPHFPFLKTPENGVRDGGCQSGAAGAPSGTAGSPSGTAGAPSGPVGAPSGLVVNRRGRLVRAVKSLPKLGQSGPDTQEMTFFWDGPTAILRSRQKISGEECTLRLPT